MFSRVLTETARHGRKVLEGFIQKAGKHEPKAPEVVRAEPPRPTVRSWLPKAAGNHHQVVPPTKGYLVQHFVRYARQNMAKELREQFSKSPIYREYSGLARKLSMFAFVGVGFAGCSGRSEAQSIDEVCNEIKSLVKMETGESQEDFRDKDLGSYHLGKMIAKGCYGVVYEAKLLTPMQEASSSPVPEEVDDNLSQSDEEVPMETEEDSDVEVLSESDSDESCSLADYCVLNQSPIEEHRFVLLDPDQSDVEVLEEDPEVSFQIQHQQPDTSGMDDQTESNHVGPPQPTENLSDDCDLAIKIVFNYDVESNAKALLLDKHKELLPIPTHDNHLDQLLGYWENGHRAKERNRLPPHPNIVAMEGYFVDDMPFLEDALDNYSGALPPKYHPDGIGRNKTLFVVMKRYTCTLRDYLAENTPLPVDHSIMLFTQLVEAVRHLTEHGIAHRDIKNNNVLLEVDEGAGCPQLVVSDFGDCLCEPEPHPLLLAHNTTEINKGGNRALMAPEIVTATPGPNKYLDYRKSDLWAVGVLSYELFGLRNPFYNGLNSATYREEDLPELPDAVPYEIKVLIKQILKPNPLQRPSPQEVATLLHLHLWKPADLSMTLTPTRSPISTNKYQLMRWLLNLTAQSLCEKGLDIRGAECVLRRCFLSKLDFEEICLAFERV